MFENFDKHALLLVLIMAGVTLILRLLPFIIFSGKETPKFVIWLGNALPPAIIGMLVVYCLKDVTPLKFPYGLPELIACGLTAILHIFKKNPLLSVGGGTLCYMLLVQLVFI